jgi:uncharacterized membrane protein YphA (DoxX/SURF4 family)
VNAGPSATLSSSMISTLRRFFSSSAMRWLGLLGLCAAYLQGGLDKALDFNAALVEMQHFGLTPPAPFAIAVIMIEIGASVLILTGVYRWAGALALGGFTLSATFLANRFWEAPAADRLMIENSFFEHLGLVGGFLLVCWSDLRAGDDPLRLVELHSTSWPNGDNRRRQR